MTRIFAEIIQKPADFVFDDKVASVFPDMLRRSIPGYPVIIDMIETLTERFAQADSKLYDLGCSLGASSFSMLPVNTQRHTLNGLGKNRFGGGSVISAIAG